MARRRKRGPLRVESLRHEEAERTNIPSAEHQPLMKDEDERPIQAAFERRNPDLDPQLVWRGKDPSDWSDLVTTAPPLYIQEKVQPKALIDDLRRTSRQNGQPAAEQLDLFADFNGLPEGADRTDFYQHQANWSNRMILGDSLQVMASLAEREGLRGKVQCIYIDPPYGIKFNSNFQWSTTSRDVRDGNRDHITREPEQVKAFRDTWRDGIHSYLTYLRDRFTVARDLLADSGSIFVQIGDENVHLVRAVMDEVFGAENSVRQLAFRSTSGQTADFVPPIVDYCLWYAKNCRGMKVRSLFRNREDRENSNLYPYTDPRTGQSFGAATMQSASASNTTIFPYRFEGRTFNPPGQGRGWRTNRTGMDRAAKADRLMARGRTLTLRRSPADYPVTAITGYWSDTLESTFAVQRLYVVQTAARVIERCTLMTTDPGDLVLDPTCGSGTTAYVAEQRGRRWITIDTSRVALALARARIMGARYPWYLLADSPEGELKEAEVERREPSSTPTYGDIRQGFVYERVPHITLRAIANNAEIDVIWETYEARLAPLRDQLSVASGQAKTLEEWEIPRERPADWPPATEPLLTAFWERRIERQREIDASIAAKADYEYLYDKPYEDKRTVRVAGPFTVESLSPHRMLGVDEHGELIDKFAETTGRYGEPQDFATMILDNLRTTGVQQAHKEDRITFSSLTPWPGRYVCAEGRFESGGEPPVEGGVRAMEGRGPPYSLSTRDSDRRAAVFVGPEFGTVSRADLVDAAREAAEADFGLLIACAFNYEAHATEFDKLGKIPVLKARMNADLHMAGELKNTGQGNLFVIFGEPDIAVASGQWLVTSSGRMIANYGLSQELSGLGGLEEINRVGRDGLSSLCEISSGREVWHDEPVATGGGVHRGEHRGGSGASRDAGVSTVPGDSERVVGGNGDIPDSGATSGADHGGRDDAAGSASVRSWANAQRAQTLAALQDLTSADFPLSLTTDHWTQVTVRGVDVFDPSAGAVRSDDTDGIACWFIDTDYDGESFFVRHAYFLGANDPYKALKTTLKAEIDADAWATLRSATSRPFERPPSGRIAVKVINHLGDEVMKVFRVD